MCAAANAGALDARARAALSLGMPSTLRAGALPLVLLAAGLASCAELAQVAKVAVEEPRLTFRSASIDALDLEGVTVGFEWAVENPNGFGLDLASLGYRLDLEGRQAVAGDLPGGLKLPARGTAPLRVPVRVRFADVPGFARLASGKDEVGYRLSGTVGVRTPVGVLALPVAHEGRLPVPRLPELSLDGLAIRSASLSEVALDVKLRVKNPNRFPLPAATLAYGVALGGAEVAAAQAKPVAPVGAGGIAVVAIPVSVSLLGAGRAAAQVAQGGPVDVAVTGSASFGGVPVPLDLRARLRAGR
jgi:LEA14-like dessication related protein